jgi:peptidyl-prolyl cis-trans isomerase C
LRPHPVRFFSLFILWLCHGFAIYPQPQTQGDQGTAQTPDEKVVISIGDQKITAKEVAKFLESLPPQYRPFYSGPGRKQLADVLINTKLQAQEAEKRGLEKREDVQMKINIARESILTAAAREEIEKEIPVSDQDLQKYLDEHVEQFEEAKVRRIVIRSNTSVPFDPSKPQESFPPATEARAKAEGIRQKLLEGADFEELAAKFSNDPMSSGKGGDLGFIRRGNKDYLIVPPLEKVIFSIKEGIVSEVVVTALGYEIVKVEERRIPKVADIRKEVEAQVKKQKGEDWLKEKKSHYTIEVDEAFFKPTTTAAVGSHKSSQ